MVAAASNVQQPTVAKVGLLGGIIALGGLVLGNFVLVRPNRLAPGVALSLFEAVPSWQWLILLLGTGLLLVLSVRPGRGQASLGLLMTPVMVLALLWSQGGAATVLVAAGGQFARVSIGSSWWIAILGLFIVFTDMLRRVDPHLAGRLLLGAGFAAALILLAATGQLDSLSLALEYASRRERFVTELQAHLFITALSIIFSAAAGLPLGLLVFKHRRVRQAVFSLLNIVQTVPSLALFGLLIAPLSYLSTEIPLLRDLGVRGIGWAPAVIALTLYALLPIVRNTYSGFASVDRAVIEAGSGMGMGALQMFAKVELPIAAPIIVNGLRIASVQNVGNTAVAALIGAGGFGVFIFQGLGQSAIDLVLLGAVPTILLAVLLDGLFQVIIKFMQPGGLA